MIQYKESSTVNGVYVRNASTTGYAEKTETETLPVSAPYVMELEEVIQPGSTITATIGGVSAEIRAYSFAASAGAICVDREHGLVKYFADDGGAELSVTYTPAGTVVSAAKFEEVADGLIGPAGEGVPAGGTAGQVLAKIDGVDYNTEWVTGGGTTDASLLTSGTLADARLSANVPLLNATINEFTGDITFGGDLGVDLGVTGKQILFGAGTSIGGSPTDITITGGVIASGTFNGDGSSLTNLSPAALSSAVPYTKGGTGLTALGTAGQVLTVNAGATALEYQTPSGGGVAAWGGITGTLADQTDLQTVLDGKASASTLTSHTSNTSNPHGVTKSQVGLGNVDNTSDANKPVSTATATALASKADSSTLSSHTSNTSNPHSVTAAQVGAYTTSAVDTLLAGKSSTSHNHTVDALSNVTIASKTDGQALVWDATGGYWKNGTVSGGGGGGDYTSSTTSPTAIAGIPLYASNAGTDAMALQWGDNDSALSNGVIGLGYYAANTAGQYSIGIGYTAGGGGSGSKTHRIGIGYNAATNGGSETIGIGRNAAVSASGQGVIGIGQQAASNVSGDHRIGIGYFAACNSSGAGHIAIGYRAGFAPNNNTSNATTSGARQTLIGYETGQSSSTQTNDIVCIGYRAIAGGTGSVAIGSGAQATHAGAVAVGLSTVSNRADSVCVGARDIEITDTTKGVILKSPDGTLYRLTVANGGTLTVTAV